MFVKHYSHQNKYVLLFHFIDSFINKNVLCLYLHKVYGQLIVSETILYKFVFPFFCGKQKHDIKASQLFLVNLLINKVGDNIANHSFTG